MDAQHDLWLEGALAVEAVRSILARPGWAAIDFETWPDPGHEVEQEVAAQPRGRKGDARKAAKPKFAHLAGAYHRIACTIQVAHEDGSAAFCRLTDPATELPAMLAPRIDIPPWEDAELCAFNALFEAEVLAKHGVALDLDDPMLAAKALYLMAVPEDRPQPTSFSLAALVEREFGRVRDKTIRSRDWRQPPDGEAVEYGIQDARDCLELWLLYHRRLVEQKLHAGYRLMVEAIPGTAASNLVGLTLDRDAHGVLIDRMRTTAADLKLKLDRICHGGIVSHSSTALISLWILEEILGYPIKAPAAPKLVGLLEFLRKSGGMRPDLGGELANRELGKLVSLAGKLSLEDATIDAWQAGYIGHEHGTFSDTRPEQDELLAAIDRELFGTRVLTLDDHTIWDAYEEQKDHFQRLHRDDPTMRARFEIRLRAKARAQWRWTAKTGHLVITKGSKLRKADQLADAYPHIAEYLLTHYRWNKARKLIEAFGPALRHWQDDDGRVRGQFKVWSAWTGRQSCVNPNLQQMPREPEFRALWVAPPGRKLVIADYSQIELRILAIESGDERLREVYREGRDVHAETASIAYHTPLADVTKEQRRLAKAINFGIAYGSGAAGLAEHGGFELAEAQMILARVLGAYPGLSDYRERMPLEAARTGYIAIKPGRRVKYTDKSSPTQAINAPIQGGAASVQMLALRLLHAALRRDELHSFVAASVHDEFLVEAPEEHAAEVATLLVDRMGAALLEIYPEAADMGLHRLTEAAVCSSWADKP